MYPKRGLIFLALAAVFFTSASLFADTIQVRINGGVTGESTDSKGLTFPATGFNFSYTGSTSIGSASGGAGAGKVQYSPIGIYKTFDSVSPVLFQDALSGSNFATVELLFFHNGSAKAYYEITLSNASITSLGQKDYKDGTPMEAITLQYQKIKEEEISTTGSTTASDDWNITTNN